MRKIKAFFHNDNDGWLSFAVAKNYYGNNIEGKEIGYGDTIDIDELKDYRVLFMDFCPKIDVYKAIKEVAISVIVIDHHKIHEDIILDSDTIHDFNKAGCTLTWEYFNCDLPYPTIIKEGENRDLFQKQYLTDFYYLGLNAIRGMYPQEHVIDLIIESFTNDSVLKSIRTTGVALMPLHNKLMFKDNNILSYYTKLGKVVFTNSPHPTLASDKAYSIYQDEEVYLVVLTYHTKDGLGFGMRTKREIDMTLIAKQFGGGGHAKACGFTVSHKEIDEVIVKIVSLINDEVCETIDNLIM